MSATPASPPRALMGTSLFHRLGLLLGLFTASLVPASADIVWDFATENATSGVPANLTVGPLTRGNNFGTENALITAMSVSGTYAGASAGNNAGAASRTGTLNLDTDGSAYFEVTLTPDASFQVTLLGITFGSRSTSSGPQAYTLRTSADGFVGNVATGTFANSGAWVLKTIPGLGLTSQTPLTLRLYGHGGINTASTGVTNWRIDDLSLNVAVGVGGGPVPTITDFSPQTGLPGTVVTLTGTNFGANPTVTFNGTPASGATSNGAGTSITVPAPEGGSTGPITVITINGAASTSSPYTYPALPALALSVSPTSFPEDGDTGATVSRPAEAPLGASLTVSLSSSNPAKATVSPSSVVIPANELISPTFTISGVPDGVFSATPATVTITASASGYTSATETLSVTNVDPAPAPNDPTVVVNKFFNSGTTADAMELLVVNTGPGSAPLNMQGMIIKDYASSMTSDTGSGKYQFNSVELFAGIKVGTLIAINVEGPSLDTSLSAPDDFTLRLSLADTTYFTKLGTGTFDISGTDMVMIKAATTGGNPTAPLGSAGAIHILASGSAGSLYTAATSAKLIAPETTGTNLVAAALNPNSNLADYNGTAAKGGQVAATIGSFGSPNNSSNNGYIRLLRGITSLSGIGLATVANTTPASPFLGRNIFGRGLSSQTVSLTLVSDVTPGGTLTRFHVSVPTELGVPLPANVTLTGAGAGSPTINVAGQMITVTGSAATTNNPAILNIAGLTTPSPTGTNADGRYEFTVTTAGPTGSLAAIAIQPSAVVLIPIESLRDVDLTTGVANDLNKVVAVEGVCTEENFNNNQLSAFIQDGNFGINIFNSRSADFTTAMIRGNRYAVTGRLIQFLGLTEINPSFAADLIDLGAGTPPTSLLVSAAQLADLSTPAYQESLEGRLITISGLSYVSGTWADPSADNINDVRLTNIAGNQITVRIAQATTANTAPSYPVSITGILSQAIPAAGGPFTGYVLMPRDPGDVVSTPAAGYNDWAAQYPAIGGPNDDADGDNQANLIEYALGTLPNDRSSVQPIVVSQVQGRPGITITKGTLASTDPQIRYVVEGSTGLSDWTTVLTPDNQLEEVVNTPTTLSVLYLGTSPRFFFRLKISPPLTP